MSMRWYLVTSPEFAYREVPLSEAGQGLWEITRDVAMVRAPDAQVAKWAATNLWEKNARPSHECWPAIQRRDNRHPLTGVRAELWDPEDGVGEYSRPDPRAWRPYYLDMEELDMEVT